MLPDLEKLFYELPLQKHQPLYITSVPSSPSAYRKRGFNQSELLAQALARKVGVTYKPLLVRKALGQSQTKLIRAERFANVAEQFSIRNKTSIDNVIIIIVDDVITTGATLASCAKVLKERGAKAVWGITVAKD